MEKETHIILPDPHLNEKQVITQEYRDSLMHFNTKRYWHCWYDVKTKRLYNEYCRLLMNDAFEYLFKNELIDIDSKRLVRFEPE